MTVKTVGYPPEQRDLARWLYGHAKDNEWNWGDVEAHSGISSTTVFRIWNGTYIHKHTGHPPDIAEECRRIETLRQEAIDRGGKDREVFVETTVFQRISKVCDEALLCNTIAMVYGESQIGKTASLKEYARRNNQG
ncbi:MAG: hypothetical protein CMO80_23360 [Verrucomicrobiales bacterium]|nr:hypothetical protein [Verrucomicrobiales bacterium]|tara:strand:+ start:947 stop:1354 length:408 start_codon:yes stop_codon:yes gene_type:complete